MPKTLNSIINYNKTKDSYNTVTLRYNASKKHKSCAHYYFARLSYSLRESAWATKKNVFYFTTKVLFILEIIKV